MSRAYRIRVNEKLHRVLRASDHVATQLELLEILPPEQMAALLDTELERRGFAAENGARVRRDQGVTVAIDPASGEVKVSAETRSKVELEATREAWGDEDWAQKTRDRHEKETRAKLKQELREQADQQQAELRRQVTDKLEVELAGLKKELDQVVNRVTAEALKRKAAQLGQIKELTEDPQTGSLTIVVEV